MAPHENDPLTTWVDDSDSAQRQKSARARAGVVALSSSWPGVPRLSTAVACEVEYVEYEDVWWARQRDPARQRYTAGGWSTMTGPGWVLSFGSLRGSLGQGGDVPVAMQDKFQQSVPIDSGSASPSVHRQSVGHYSCGTETGTHSAKLRRRTS